MYFFFFSSDKISLKLIASSDTEKLRMSEGVYDIHVTTVSIEITLLHKGDSRSTPVEPFGGKEPVKSVTLPLTHIARFKLEKVGSEARLAIDTIP